MPLDVFGEAPPDLDITTQKPQVPRGQAPEFLAALQELTSRGLLTQRQSFTDSFRQITQSEIVPEGLLVPVGGLFEAGIVPQPDLTPLTDQLDRYKTHTLDQSRQQSQYIPRDQSEPTGFMRVLEWLSASLYATTGFVNGTINLLQGERTENNPFAEAWDGFRLRDRETWSTVFENLGWTGQDGFSKGSRATLGFIADVFLDPINFVTFGSAAAGRALLGAGKTIPLAKTAIFGGTKQSVNGVIDGVRKRIASKLIRGETEFVGGAGSKAVVERLRTELAESTTTIRQLIARQTGRSEDELIQVLTKEKSGFTGDEILLANELGSRVDTAILRLLGASSRTDDIKALLATEGNDIGRFVTEAVGDPFAADVLVELMRADNLVDDLARVTPADIVSYLDDIPKIVDPGGFGLGIPFTDARVTLIPSRTMDRVQFRIHERIAKSVKSMANVIERTAGKRFLKTIAAPFKLIKSGLELASEGKGRVKRLFGVELKESPLAAQMFDKHRGVMDDIRRRHVATVDALVGRMGDDVDFNDAIWDAFMTEERHAQSFRENMLPEMAQSLEDGAVKFSDVYQPQFVPSVGRRLLDMGYSKEQADLGQSIANEIHQLTQETGDMLVRHGLADAARDFYIPLQFENQAKVANLRFTESKERGFSVLRDSDAFMRMRTMDPETAAREFGLTPIKDIGTLLYNRLVSLDAVLEQRRFIEEFVQEFGINVNHIQDFLDAAIGPQGQIATDLIAAIRDTTPRQVLRDPDTIRQLQPRLQVVWESIRKGDWEEANAFLDANPDLASVAFEPILDSLKAEAAVSQSAVAEFMAAAGNSYYTRRFDLAPKIGRIFEQVTEESTQRSLLAGLSRAVEKRVRSRLGIPDDFDVSALSILEAERVWDTGTSGKHGVRAAASETLLADEVVGAQSLAAIERKYGSEIEEMADLVATLVTERLHPESALYPGFGERFAVLLARLVPLDIAEGHIAQTGRMATREFRAGSLRQKVRLFEQAIEGGVRGEELRVLADEFAASTGTAPEIIADYVKFRESNALPDVPVGPEFRAELRQFIQFVKQSADDLGFDSSFLRTPILGAPGRRGRAAVRKKQELQKLLGKMSRGNQELWNTYFSLLTETAGNRAGFHYEPFKGVRALLEASYNGRVNRFLDKFRKLAEDHTPAKIAEAMEATRLTERAPVSSPLNVPHAWTQAHQKRLEASIGTLERSIRNIREQAGIEEKDIKTAFTQFRTMLRQSTSLDPDRNFTKVWQRIEEVTDRMGELYGQVFRDMHQAEVAQASLSRFADELIARQEELAKVSRQNEEISVILRDVVSDPARFVAADVNDTLRLLDEVYESYYRGVDQIEQMAEEVLGQPVVPTSRLPAELLRESHPEVGSLLEAENFLQTDRLRVDDALEKTIKEQRIAQSEAHLKASKETTERLAERAKGVLDAEQNAFEPARLLEDVARGSVVSARQRVNALLSEHVGFRVDIADSQSMEAAFEFLEFGARAEPPVTRAVSFEAVDQREVLRSYVDTVVAHEFARRKPGGNFEDLQEVVRELAEKPPLRKTFPQWKTLQEEFGSQGLAELLQESLRRAAPSELRTGIRTATSFYATARFTSDLTPPDLESTRALLGGLLDSGRFTDLKVALETDQNFLEAVTARQAEILRDMRGAEGLIGFLASRATLRPENARRVHKAMREESAYIRAFMETIERQKARLGLVSPLDDPGLAGPFEQIRDAFRQSMIGRAPEGFHVEQFATQQADNLLADLRAGVVGSEQRAAVLGFTPDEIETMRSATNFDRTIDTFVAEAQGAVEAHYGRLLADVGDPSGIDAVRREGAFRALRQALDEYAPGILQSADPLLDPNVADKANEILALFDDIDPGLGDLLLQVPPGRNFLEFLTSGEAGSSFSNRGYNVLQHLGFVSDSSEVVSNVGLRASTKRRMLRDLGRYTQGDEWSTVARKAREVTRQPIADIAEEYNSEIALHRMSELETGRMSRRVQDMKDAKLTDLDFSPEAKQKHATLIHLDQTLAHARLNFEREMLEDLRKQLPSQTDVELLRTRAIERGVPVELDLTGRPLGPTYERVLDESGNLTDMVVHPRAGAVPEANARIIDQFATVSRDEYVSDINRVLRGPARELLRKFGVDISDVPTEQDLLRELWERGIAGIPEKGGPDFAAVREEYGIRAADGLRDTLQMLKRAEDGSNFGHFGATDMQVAQLEKMLNRVAFKSDDLSKEQMKVWLLHLVSSKTNPRKLTAAEATHAIAQLREQFDFRFPRDISRISEVARLRGILDDRIKTAQNVTARNRALTDDPEDLVGADLSGLEMVKIAGRDADLSFPNTFLTKGFREMLRDEIVRGNVISSESMNWMLRGFDRLTNMWKGGVTWPFLSFHTRNVSDGTFRSMLALGVKSYNLRNSGEMWQALRGKPGTVTIRQAGTEIVYDNALWRQMLVENGLVVSFRERIGQVPTGPPDFHPHSGERSYIWGVEAAQAGLRGLSRVGDAIKNVASDVDNTFRAVLFKHALEEGMPIAEAARWTQKFLFNYASLTGFEKNVMRRMVPFYAFSRFSIPLALETLYKRPGLVAAFGKTRNLFGEQDEFEELVPKFVRQQWRFFPEVDVATKTLRVWSGQNLVHLEDLGMLTAVEFWRGEQFKEVFMHDVIGRINPLVRVPFEMIVGHNFYFNRKIYDDITIRDSVARWPVISDFLQSREVVVGDETFIRVNGTRWTLLNGLHFSRFYRELNKLVPADNLNAEYERWVPIVTGIRLRQIDLERRWQHAVQVSNFHRNKVLRAFNEGDPVLLRRLTNEILRSPEEQANLELSFRNLRAVGHFGITPQLADSEEYRTLVAEFRQLQGLDPATGFETSTGLY